MSEMISTAAGFAPEGLVPYLDSLPFLGRVTSSHAAVVAGSTEEFVFDYEVGAAALADGGWFKITFKFYSDWAPFQTTNPAGANYLSAEYLPRPVFRGESAATVRELRVRFDQKGHERPYQKAIIVDVVDGYLKPGDVIRVRVGDRRFGGPGTRVQTFAEESFRFRAYVDTAGTSRFAAVPGDLVLRIAPGAPERLVITTPRLVRTGQPFVVRVRAEDAWGNPSEDLPGTLRLHWRGASTILPWPRKGWATIKQTLVAAEPGTQTVEAVLDGPDALQTRALVTAEAGFPAGQTWFADLHVHSHDTVGTNPTEQNFAYAREVAGLDVLGYTVNDFQIRADHWTEALALVNRFHRDAEFVVFPGTEWCGSSAVGGDHNVIFLGDEVRFPQDAQGRSLRSFEWNEHTAVREPTPGRWPLSRLYEAYADAPEKFLFIPHVGGRRALLDWHHPELDRLIEITSAWGHFHWFYQEAMARGWKLGASAAGDEHRGRPGGGAPGVSVFGVRGGLTGVLASRLDRPSVAAALRARHTWATTGDRHVALLQCGAWQQGDEFAHSGPATLTYRLYGDAGWEYLALYDQTGILFERDLAEELGLSRTRLRVRWGGARIKDRYRWAVWRGHLTVKGTTFRLRETSGLEHPEETVEQTGSRELRFFSETYGDFDGAEIEVENLRDARFQLYVEIDGFNKTGDPTARNPWPDCPEVLLEISGEELFTTRRIRRDLPGVELFVEVERTTEAALPTEISGTWTLPAQNASYGFRPVYLYAREPTGAKVWTSPLFIRYEN